MSWRSEAVAGALPGAAAGLLIAYEDKARIGIAREECVTLSELLSVPYLLEAEAIETAAGQWLLRLAYPELPGCTAEGFLLEDVLRDLERRRIEMIVSLLEAGQTPPVPRKPLVASDPLWTARDLGLSGRIASVPARSAE